MYDMPALMHEELASYVKDPVRSDFIALTTASIADSSPDARYHLWR